MAGRCACLFIYSSLQMSFPVALQIITIGEIAIELYVPDEIALKQAYRDGKIAFPYWGKLWPSSIALSRFIVNHPQYIENKKLAELGAGLGLPSLVAARYADSVLCSDHDAEAVTIVERSALHNRLRNLETMVMDWHHLPEHFEADVLLLSDVNYEPSGFGHLLQLVNTFLGKDTTVLISTPQRLMAKEFIAPLLPNTIHQEENHVEWHGQQVMITVLVLSQLQPHLLTTDLVD